MQKRYLPLSIILAMAGLSSGCTPVDTYYSSTSYGVVPLYYTDKTVYYNKGSAQVESSYFGSYQSQQVVNYWPYYSRPYIQRQYYYNWN